MSLSAKLAAPAAQGKPVRVGLIGTGKFGSLFLPLSGSYDPQLRGWSAWLAQLKEEAGARP